MKPIFFLTLMTIFLLDGCAHRARREVQVKVSEQDGERVAEVSPTPTPSETRDPFAKPVDPAGLPRRP